MSTQPKTKMAFFEIDLDSVVRRKSAMIDANPELHSLVSPDWPANLNSQNGEIRSNNYCLICADLQQQQQIESRLVEVGFDCSAPTVFLSECVLTYLSERYSTRLIAWAHYFNPRSMFVLYEQIHPYDCFGTVMTSHFAKINSPLRSICAYPSIAHQLERFQNCGWAATTAISMSELFYQLPQEERRRVVCIEPFDEYEEWALKASHYCVIIAAGSGAFAEGQEVKCHADHFSNMSVHFSSIFSNIVNSPTVQDSYLYESHTRDSFTHFSHSCVQKRIQIEECALRSHFENISECLRWAHSLTAIVDPLTWEESFLQTNCKCDSFSCGIFVRGEARRNCHNSQLFRLFVFTKGCKAVCLHTLEIEEKKTVKDNLLFVFHIFITALLIRYHFPL